MVENLGAEVLGGRGLSGWGGSCRFDHQLSKLNNILALGVRGSRGSGSLGYREVLGSHEGLGGGRWASGGGVAVADPGFSPGGASTPKIAIIFHIFAENCMKMKEFGPPGGGARPWRPPWIRQCVGWDV